MVLLAMVLRFKVLEELLLSFNELWLRAKLIFELVRDNEADLYLEGSSGSVCDNADGLERVELYLLLSASRSLSRSYRLV